MESAEYRISDVREETVRTERVKKRKLNPFSLSLSIGGTVRLSVLDSVEEHVGQISRENEFKVNERGDYYLITVYRTKEVCSVSDCSSTANSKLDGNWLCDSHRDSYAARFIG